MNRMIVAVFDNETKAFEGLSAMKELHKNGDISLYASAVINKNEAGEIALKSAAEQGPIGMGVGMLSGAFIGLLAGPVGMAVGAMAGTMGGMIYDLDKSGVDTTFVEEVSDSLKNGKTAVIADVDEGWNAPVDTRMDALDAMVFRRNRSEVADEQFNREAEAINAELDELEEEWDDANDEMKESIKKQIDKTKKKSQAMKEVVDKKMAELKAETDAKTSELNKQMKEAGERKKKKLDKRMTELDRKYTASLKKLSLAADKLSKFIG